MFLLKVNCFLHISFIVCLFTSIHMISSLHIFREKRVISTKYFAGSQVPRDYPTLMAVYVCYKKTIRLLVAMVHVYIMLYFFNDTHHNKTLNNPLLNNWIQIVKVHCFFCLNLRRRMKIKMPADFVIVCYPGIEIEGK